MKPLTLTCTHCSTETEECCINHGLIIICNKCHVELEQEFIRTWGKDALKTGQCRRVDLALEDKVNEK